MAPRFNRGARIGAQKTGVLDARQIIQRNKSNGRFKPDQRLTIQNDFSSSIKMSGRLGLNRKNNEIGKSKRMNSKLAGRIGNIKKWQNQTVEAASAGFRSNFNVNVIRSPQKTQVKVSPHKKVLFLGKKLLVTSKQENTNQISFQENPMLSSNSSRNTVNQSSIETIEQYLRAANMSSRSYNSITSLTPTLTAASSSSSLRNNAKIGSFGLLVSNLHPSVTEDDIIELFSDVGSVSSAKLQHPGAALIVYERREDAEKACQVYHNRLLDDLPMQCSILGGLEQQHNNKSRIASRLGGRLDFSSSSQSSFSAPLFGRGQMPVSLSGSVGGGVVPMMRSPLQRLPPTPVPNLVPNSRQAYGNRERDVTFTVKLP